MNDCDIETWQIDLDGLRKWAVENAIENDVRRP